MGERGLTRRRLLAAGGAGAAGAVGAVVGASPADAAGTDRGMTYTVVASNAGAPFQNNGDAQCDGTADNVEIQAAIDAVAAAGGGTVELSRGTFNTAATIVMKSDVTLRGQGSGQLGSAATTLVRAGNFTLVRANGPATGDHIHNVSLRDLRLDGTALSATGLEVHYADSFLIDRITFGGVYGHAIEAVEWWDSIVTNSRFDYCGSRDGSNVPAVGIYQSRPGVPSSDNSNGLKFTNCIWETFADGAIGLFGSATNHCYFTNLKIETGTLRGVPIRVDGCIDLQFRNVRTSIGNFENQASPQDIFTIINSWNIVIDGYEGFCQNGGFQTVRTLLSLKGGNHHIYLTNLLLQAGVTNKPSVAAIEFTGINEGIDLGYHGYGWDGSGTAVLRTGTTTKKFQNSGTANIGAAATNVNVTHNLGKTPVAADISITPTADIGAARKFWISNVTATTFRINLNVAPGAATSFAWQAEAY
jgi:hypothetical protein